MKHNEERMITAYHEAGHAVVAELLGIGVERVYLSNDTDGKTVTKLHKKRNKKIYHFLIDRLCFFIAGELSTRAFTPRKEKWKDCAKDLENVGALLLTCLDYDYRKSLLEKAYTKTKKLLQQNKGTVASIAEALIEYNKLSGCELRKIIN